MRGSGSFRRHLLRLTVLLVAACSILVAATSSTVGAAPDCPAGATLNVVAHPDDDLLFLSPDLLHDIRLGRCVRTVFVTAGERGPALDALAAREAGIKAAYANMAGVTNSWTTADAGVSGHPMSLVTLADYPSVSLVFMRLPEGFWGPGGTSSDETLANLWNGTVAEMHAEDGSSVYTATSLTSTLTSLMSAFQPDTIRTQDYVGTFGDGDHDDHHAAAYFAERAQRAYATSHTFVGYQDYETSSRPQNVFDPDLTAKTDAFYAYLAFDSAPCGDPPQCGNNDYSAWLTRQYVAATESSTTDTTPPAGGGATGSGGDAPAPPPGGDAPTSGGDAPTSGSDAPTGSTGGAPTGSTGDGGAGQAAANPSTTTVPPAAVQPPQGDGKAKPACRRAAKRKHGRKVRKGATCTRRSAKPACKRAATRKQGRKARKAATCTRRKQHRHRPHRSRNR
jgi:LmbE family N-acetylglucosaminyl deacetylase